jgi:uridine phosphorylase
MGFNNFLSFFYLRVMKASELILNADGSVYHLGLRPEDIAPIILTVGDPERVPLVSRYFDSIRLKKNRREMVTHTGRIGNIELTVLSTGMGTDNIDIVMNELDALVNIDFESRAVKEKLSSLPIIRIGTSGCIQEDIAIDSILVSEWAIGYDGLLGFYGHAPNEFDDTILPELGRVRGSINPGSKRLLQLLGKDCYHGVTYTAAGFYAPQARQLRARLSDPDLLSKLSAIRLPGGRRVTNIEMETAGLYGLGDLLGHEVISFSVLLAHRIHGHFSAQPEKSVDRLIRMVLERLPLLETPTQTAECPK